MGQHEHLSLPIVDSHLDLAENVTLFGRDLTLSVSEIRAREKRNWDQATVALPELERGAIAVAFATVTGGFRPDEVKGDPRLAHSVYHTAQEAESQALSQLELYEHWEREGRVRILKSRSDLQDHLSMWKRDYKPGLLLLMEGADPIVRVSDLPKWWDLGLRMIGLTFGDTRYGRGVSSGRPQARHGGLTPEGLELLRAMAAQGVIWDISHLAEDGVWQGLDEGYRSVCASHATARTLIPTDRHLTDKVIRAVARRGGVIGIPLYNGFLEQRWRDDKTLKVTLNEHVRRHLDYMARLTGWTCLGIGSDLDGGFGRESTPVEIDTVADLFKIGAVVPEAARESVLGANWLDFLNRCLPSTS